MRPILLQGHTRSLTQIKYNREGDLLFSVSKDKVANVWYSHNGERLGTYTGHVGAVWTIDVNGKSFFTKRNTCIYFHFTVNSFYRKYLLLSLEIYSTLTTCIYSNIIV